MNNSKFVIEINEYSREIKNVVFGFVSNEANIIYVPSAKRK